jgi:response regulator RpfG family c-di-GMP phosphodiesterase
MAKAIILQGNGTHFDPMVIVAFLACEESFFQIYERFRDDKLDK